MSKCRANLVQMKEFHLAFSKYLHDSIELCASPQIFTVDWKLRYLNMKLFQNFGDIPLGLCKWEKVRLKELLVVFKPKKNKFSAKKCQSFRDVFLKNFWHIFFLRIWIFFFQKWICSPSGEAYNMAFKMDFLVSIGTGTHGGCARMCVLNYDIQF